MDRLISVKKAMDACDCRVGDDAEGDPDVLYYLGRAIYSIDEALRAVDVARKRAAEREQ